MHRRTFLHHTALLSALPFLPAQASALFSAASGEVVRHRIGKMKCTFFRDNTFQYQMKDFFINAGGAELQQEISRYQPATSPIASPFLALLVEQGEQKILIDTGAGFTDKPINVRGQMVTLKGRLHHLLQQEGISKTAITDVIITHFHPDHIGGIYTPEGIPHFPNARFHMHEAEWDFWHTARSESQPGQFHFFIENNITRLKNGNLHLIKGDFTRILPGITAMLADGHTPGQIALILHSRRDHLLYISDAFLHPLHIEHLDWQTNYDADHSRAKASRSKLLDLAHREDMLINAFHFDFPGLGRVERKGKAWRWVYGAGN